MADKTHGSNLPDKSQWPKAKAFIDGYKEDDGVTFPASLANLANDDKGKALEKGLNMLSTKDRMNFVQDFLQQGLNEAKAFDDTERNQPALTVEEYLKALNSIKFNNESSIASFYASTSSLNHRPAAKPVKLGNQEKLQYFMRPQLTFFDIEPIEANSADLHPYYVRFSSKTGAKPSIQIGLHLGMMQFTSLTDSEAEFLHKTPLHLFLNPLPNGSNKAGSIWLVANRSFVDDQGNQKELSDRESIWPWCGLAEASLRPCDCLQLFSAEEVQASTNRANSKGLEQRQDLFDRNVLATGNLHCLVAQPVTKRELENLPGWPRAIQGSGK